MSRNVLCLGLISVAALVSAGAAPPALGQSAPSAQQALAQADKAYGPDAPEPECTGGADGEIVVCAKEQEQSQFRIRSDKQAESDYARETMFANDPQAPDVAGPGIFKGKATIGGCIKGLTCPPPTAIDVDFAQLPVAPPGSDADRIARGLPPIGNETGDSAAPARPPER